MNTGNTGRERLGILMGGGPAPGVNSAINAATIEAIHSGLDVIGIYDGFKHLIEGRTDMARPLNIQDVAQIHFQGGSILRTSRANPARKPGDLQRVVQALRQLDIRYLVTIGGDDTAFGAAEVSKAANGAIKVAHIPKTIDNDLPLPGNMPTFGFETARHLGTELARNLMQDAITTSRWYFVTVMGRMAGHLALGIGKAAGATLTVIPEEFPSPHVTLGEVCDVLEAAILKQKAQGEHSGLAVLAEGISEKLKPEELADVPGITIAHDAYGHLRLEEIPLEDILKRMVQQRFAERGDPLTIVARTIGYELRSAPPIPWDVDYTRTLGFGAVRVLLSTSDPYLPPNGGLICLKDGRLTVLAFDELRDPDTGRTRVRMVDMNGESYFVARKYMVRLEKSDLTDPQFLARLALVAQMTPEEIISRFTPLVALAGAIS